MPSLPATDSIPGTLSIVIPAYNEEKLLPSTLESVRGAIPAFEEQGWRCEVIVCDNNSTDRTGEVAREGGAKVIFEEKNQIARARNRGASIAQGEWLLFLDADSRVSRELLAALFRTISDERVIGGSCCFEFSGGPRSLIHRTCFIWNLISRLTRWTAGSFTFCRHDAFSEIGFCEEVYVSEDYLFGKAMKKWARHRGKTTRIIKEPRLLTSDRKIHLYSSMMLISTLFRLVFLTNRTVRDPKRCAPWYDGKR